MREGEDVHMDHGPELIAGGLRTVVDVCTQTSPQHATGDTDSQGEAVEPPEEPCPKRVCVCALLGRR